MPIILPYKNKLPKIEATAFIAANVVISGDVTIGANSGIWYGTVIRGDVASISIGNNTNIQDNSVVHVTRAGHKQNKTGDSPANTSIGDNVTVGHKCIMHACTIANNAFIGMGSTLMDMSHVEEFGMIAAGSVLTPAKIVKYGELWAGVPAKFFRRLTEEEMSYIKTSADNYRILAEEYKLIERNYTK